MMTCGAVIGAFKCFARFQAIDNFSFIMFVRYSILNAFEVAQWRTCWLVMLMTWVRAPGLHAFNIIFRSAFTCRFHVETHHTPPNQACHVHLQINHKAES